MSSSLSTLEKAAEREAKHDASNLKAATKALTHAEKSEHKGAKAEEKALHARDKALKAEQKTASKLIDAEKKHNNAIADQKKAEQDILAKKQKHDQLQEDIAQKKAALEQAEAAHRQGEADRLAQLEQARNPGVPAGGAGVVNDGAYPATTATATGAPAATY